MGRWSWLARLGSRISDNRVGGEMAPAEQFFRMRQADRTSKYQSAFSEIAGKRQLLLSDIKVTPEAKTLLGADTLQSQQGNDFLTRFYEGAQTRNDMRLRQLLGPSKVDALVNNWRGVEDTLFDFSKSRGMKAAKATDLYGGRWSPRAAKEAKFDEYGTGLSRANYTTQLLENEARQRYLKTPGITVDLREISALPAVRQLIEEGEKSSRSFAEVGEEIKRFLDTKHGPGAADPRVVPFKTYVPKLGPDGKPLTVPKLDATGAPVLNKQGTPVSKVVYDPTQVITQRQGEKIARFMSRMDPNLPPGSRMFDEFTHVSFQHCK